MVGSGQKAFAATLNLAACLMNVAFAWLLINRGSDFYVFNVCAAIFSGTLALANFVGYLNAKDDEFNERLRNRISGKY